ncbi:MAG: phosphoribosyl-ATP diphosphatase [Candidatus Puniceispirillales bacterium]
MDARIVDELYALILSRRGEDTDTSWTARLLAEAPERPAQKLGEEAVECVIAAMRGDTASLTGEAADLIYHLLVVLAAAGVSPQDVWAELDRRQGQSGIAEKASRQ